MKAANVWYRTFSSGLAAAGISVFAVQASAQDASFKADHFEPLPAQSTELGSVSRTSTLRHLAPSAGISVHFADDVLQVDRGDEVAARLIDEQLVVEPSLALGLFGRFQIGAIIPTIVYQTGEAFEGVRSDAPSTATIGDLRIVPKVRILSPESARGFGIALAAPVGIPTGDAESFATDGNVRVEPRAIFDYEHASGFVVAANVGFLLRPEQSTDVFVAGNAVRWGAAVAVPVADAVGLFGTAFGTLATVDGIDSDAFKANPAEWNAGIRLNLPAGLLAQLGGGTGLTSGVGAPDFRINAGLSWSPTDDDTDGDGVMDSVDQCPEEPGPIENNGCPWGDRDGDKVLDPNDECPDEPGAVENNGCPWGDRDGDTVLDPDDLCPDEAGEPENRGCPWGDQDGDGIIDPKDKCPQDPEDMDGFQDEDGCPDTDNDHDGIPDATDKCPDEAEVINGVEDDDGCPDEGESKVRLTQKQIEILDKVFFDYNKSSIRPESFNLLRQVGATIRANPEILEIKIEGHTDDKGPDDYNLKLSQERADSVRTFLIEYGIAADRLVALGHGETKPLATNETELGRDQNRRVEFNIVRTAPTEEVQEAQ